MRLRSHRQLNPLSNPGSVHNPAPGSAPAQHIPAANPMAQIPFQNPWVPHMYHPLSSNLSRARPVFDGSNAIPFMEEFLTYLAIAQINVNTPSGASAAAFQLTDCARDPNIANHIRANCVQPSQGGVAKVARTWPAIHKWFLGEYATKADTDSYIRKAKDALSSRDSDMRNDESFSAFLVRYSNLVRDLRSAYHMWNGLIDPGPNASQAQARKFADEKKRFPMTEQVSGLLQRLNQSLFGYADCKFNESSDWGVVVDDLKCKDESNERTRKRFPVTPAMDPSRVRFTDAPHVVREGPDPYASSFASSSSSRSSPTNALFAEMQSKLEEALNRVSRMEQEARRTKQEATLLKPLKGQSLTPINAAQSADEAFSPSRTDGTTASTQLHCTRCGVLGHLRVDCTRAICDQCGEGHLREHCGFRIDNLFCPDCSNVGHVPKVCPYRFTGPTVWMKHRSREEAVKTYRRNVDERNRRLSEQSGAPPSSSPGVCFDWVRGRCVRRNCRFSHDDTRKRREPPRRRARSPSRTPPRDRRDRRKRRRSRSPSPPRSQGRRDSRQAAGTSHDPRTHPERKNLVQPVHHIQRQDFAQGASASGAQDSSLLRYQQAQLEFMKKLSAQLDKKGDDTISSDVMVESLGTRVAEKAMALMLQHGEEQKQTARD